MQKIQMVYKQKFYNSGETLISTELRQEVETALSTGIDCSHRRLTNSCLRAKLLTLGWHKEFRVGKFRRFAIDFKKDLTGMEIELRQGTNLVHDLLKLERAFQQEMISNAILIAYDCSVGICGKNGMNASFQEFHHWVNEFSGIINFKVPMWVIGLQHSLSKSAATREG